MPMMMMASREVRRVPAGWEHPAGEALTEDEMPSVEGLPPEDVRIVMYETVSEGALQTPPFEDTPAGRLALTEYCAEHCNIPGTREKGDAEMWAAMLFSDGVALVDEDGRVHA